MIASWVLYACLFTALVSVAAIAMERVAISRGWPLRIVWAGAMLLSIAWPVASAARALLPAGTKRVTVLPFSIAVEPSRIIADRWSGADWPALIDRGVVVLWCVLSALLLLRLARGVATLERTRHAWTRGRIDGTPVRLSENVGPAVVGLRSMDVVIPEWILTLDAPLRAIVLRHEEEHRAARDPYLLFVAAIAVVLLPWNVALWLQARRLRLAIEMDCDARVLRAHPSPERYGLLMLTIAQRRSVAPTLFAPMMTEPTTQLERRIIAMRSSSPRLGRLTMSLATAVAITSLTVACSLQAGGSPLSKPVTSRLLAVPPAAAAPAGATTDAEAQPHNPAPQYPDMLRAAEIEGQVTAQWTTDAEGAPIVSGIRIISSTHDLFTRAVLNVLPRWHSAPHTQYEIPFVFVMSNKTGARAFDAPRNATIVAASPLTESEIAARRNAARVLHGEPTPVSDNQTFFEFQVENQVKPQPGNHAPRYPDELREQKIEGTVLAQFVVGTDGVPLANTFKVLKSTDDRFTAAVLSALPDMLFYPALVGGKPVKQLVQMPFQFNLTKEP